MHPELTLNGPWGRLPGLLKILRPDQLRKPAFPKIQSGGDSRGEAESAHNLMRWLPLWFPKIRSDPIRTMK
jgi:hypothetical protein